VTILEGVTQIGEGAFQRCTGLTSVHIPTNVDSVGQGAFAGCSGLLSVTIAEGVFSIGIGAFAECSGLTSLSIPNSVEKIWPRTFWKCDNLLSIDFGPSTEIYPEALKDCFNLKAIFIRDEKVPTETKIFGIKIDDDIKPKLFLGTISKPLKELQLVAPQARQNNFWGNLLSIVFGDDPNEFGFDELDNKNNFVGRYITTLRHGIEKRSIFNPSIFSHYSEREKNAIKTIMLCFYRSNNTLPAFPIEMIFMILNRANMQPIHPRNYPAITLPTTLRLRSYVSY